VIHYKGNDGLMILEHHEIMNRVESHSLMDPDSLLPQHCHLMSTDFTLLGSGPASDRLIWLADMDSALAASALSHTGTLTLIAEAHFSQALYEGR
jgi:hypothetical protein